MLLKSSIDMINNEVQKNCMIQAVMKGEKLECIVSVKTAVKLTFWSHFFTNAQKQINMEWCGNDRWVNVNSFSKDVLFLPKAPKICSIQINIRFYNKNRTILELEQLKHHVTLTQKKRVQNKKCTLKKEKKQKTKQWKWKHNRLNTTFIETFIH